MGQDETSLLKRLQIMVSPLGWRVFRNLVGEAWMGVKSKERMGKDKSGALVRIVELFRAYHVTVGLGPGSSDTVGWRPLPITQDMVGQTVAQFVAVEIKTQKYKKTTSKQDNFLHQVHAAGGYAAVLREQKDGSLFIDEIS